MTKTISGGREFDGHERLFLPLKVQKIRLLLTNACAFLDTGQNLIHDLLPDDLWQKVIQHHPLIMPADCSLNLCKLRCDFVSLFNKLHHSVVKPDHDGVKL